MTMKKGLICLSIVAIVVFCTLNVATASTGNYSTKFCNSARHTDAHLLIALGSTANGISNWLFVAKGILASPSMPKGTVYIGSLDHNVYALDANTGAEVWSYTTGDSVGDVPIVANGIVYVGSLDHNVYALDANTGAKVWSYTTKSTLGRLSYSSPAVVNGVVYIGIDKNISALDAATGAMLWSYTTGNIVESSPAIANGTVYVEFG
ncbi:MAG TPA: PQQ-binding-like beta-propeller repeat protein [Candidatus Acidoferrum sp.]|nr:PQQ-binding-like beta-propeller repeat protein [Candidatus Acidoferrum sp.]